MANGATVIAIKRTFANIFVADLSLIRLISSEGARELFEPASFQEVERLTIASNRGGQYCRSGHIRLRAFLLRLHIVDITQLTVQWPGLPGLSTMSTIATIRGYQISFRKARLVPKMRYRK